MQHEILKHLHDIKESIDSIYEYLGDNRDFKEYKTNKLLRRGIERELEIIGEATNRIIKIDSSIEISDSRRIVDLRNWVIHRYDKVDDIIIWGIISKDIPRLREQIDKIVSPAYTVYAFDPDFHHDYIFIRGYHFWTCKQQAAGGFSRYQSGACEPQGLYI